MNDFLVGTGLALVTPFDEEGRVDFESLKKLLTGLIASDRLKYLVLFGSTAETFALREEEQTQVTDFVYSLTKDKIPLVVGISHNSTEKLIEKVKKTNLSKFRAILSVCPYYNRASQEGIYRHFEALARATQEDIILYNVPSRTASNMLAQTSIELATNYKNIIGIKEASGDFGQICKLIELKNNSHLHDFKIISGDDFLALPSILAGAQGVISVIGQGILDKFSKMIDLALQKKPEEAYSIFYQISPLISLLYEEGNPTGIKELLRISNKISSSNLRIPLTKASEQLSKKLEKEYAKLLV